MTKKERYTAVLTYLESTMKGATTELDFGSPFQLLVAVVLSAQCTDKRVNMVTKELFKAMPTAQDMARADEEEVLRYISSVSYPNSKAHYLVGLSKMITDKFNGEVPSTMEELTMLPGVGRKTANVILALVYNKAAIPVDTHVFRVSHRLGLVSDLCTTPLSVEIELKKHIPPNKVVPSHFWFLTLGRYTCTARAPKCAKCGLQDVCRNYQIGQKKIGVKAKSKNNN